MARTPGQADPNFAVRWTLAEATEVRAAVERQRDVLLTAFHSISPASEAGADAAEREALGERVARLETILRRDL
jgi:hypothetical protein